MIINENSNCSITDLAPLIEESVNQGGRVRIKVTGISMSPILHNLKDTVDLVKADNIKKYDIVLHKRHTGQYILHRVIKKKNNILTIAGDLEVEKEYPVYEDMVIAKVVAFCRNGKNYSVDDFVIRLYSRIWVLIFPLRHHVLCALNFIRRLIHV